MSSKRSTQTRAGAYCVYTLLTCAVLSTPCAARAQTWTKTRLTGNLSQYPYLTGDGSKIVFTYTGTGWYNVWTVNADGTNLTQVTSHGSPGVDYTPAISDDGQRIVFASNADLLGTNPEGNREVYTVYADGSGLTQITFTTSGWGGSPEITDDGSKICFTMHSADLTGQNPDLGTELYVANFDGSGIVQISNTGSEGATGGMSGDGSVVVWTPSAYGTNTVYRCNTDGSGTTALLTLEDACVLPRHALTDDGSVAVFRSDDDPFGTNADGNNEIFAVHVRTGFYWQVTQTTEPGFPGNANIRPFIGGDGTLILFMTENDITGQNPDEHPELFICCTDGSNLKQITSFSDAVPTNIDWSFVSVDDRGDVVTVITRDDFAKTEYLNLWRLDSVEPDTDGDGLDDACYSPSGQLGWTDIKVNSEFPGSVQNEPSLTLNPIWPANLVFAYNDIPWPGGPGLGISFSTDYGVSWFDRQLILPPAKIDMFDPITTADTLGNVYAGCVATDGMSGGASGIYIYRSSDGGSTWWLNPSVAGSEPNRLCDKPHMTADTYAGSPYTDNVYVAWIEDFATSGPYADIYFNYSTNAGVSFSTQQRISDLPSGQDMGNGPNIAVAPDGTVYVIWLEFDVTLGGQTAGNLMLDRSFDGGATFGADNLVAPILTIPNNLSDFATGTDARARSFPCMEVSPLNSQEVYVVYAEDPDGAHTGDEADVYFIKSTDGGFTWSTPLRLNNQTGGHEFEPWMDVKPDGTIDVVWYEAPGGSGPTWDVMFSRSIDRGVSFSPPATINDQSFATPTDAWLQPWMGEYLAIAVDQYWAYVGWTSSVADQYGDIYFDRVENTTAFPRGDTGCDGTVNNFDIDPFVLALTDPLAYELENPGCNILNADCDNNGEVNNFDIDAFVELLTAR